jgi:multiple sugar transport system substrate-binding protein
MADTELEDSRSKKPLKAEDGISRRELLKVGGKAAVGAAVFGPLILTSKAAATKPLSFWQFYAPGGAAGDQQSKWFVDCVTAWNATHDVKVQLEYVPVQEYINGSTLQTSFVSGQGPDIFIISPGDFLRYFNGGLLADLTPYMEEEAKKDFFPNVMETRIVGGKIYGLPMEVEPMAMYYSIKAFQKAGLSEANIPKTWDQFLEIAKKLTNGDQFGCLFETIPGYYQTFTWYPFMWQAGGDIVTPDGRKSVFGSAGTVQALEFWQKSITRNVAPRSFRGGGGLDVVSNLASGYCAMQNAGIWGVYALRHDAKDFQYGVFPLPTPVNGVPKTVLGGWAFVANAKGQNPEEAAKFCVWAIGSMQDDSIQRVADWCVKAKSDVAPRKSALEKATEQGGYDSGPMKLFKDVIAPTGRGEPRVPSEVYKVISDAIQACQLSDADPQRTAEEASRRIDTFLASYTGAPLR